MSESLRQPESHEIYLTEVDHLNRFRQPDGSHDPHALQGVHENLTPAVKEASMPFAESTVYQEYRDGTFWWLDQTPTQVARSGYRFHKHPAALERVAVEEDEADDTEHNLTPGMIKMFISPRMSRKDAPYEVAKEEHLGDDDMLRIHMLDVDEHGQIKGKFMQSLLVRDVPLSAWVKMLRDPKNILGKSVSVEDEESALSVMKVHAQLEVPEAALPEGVISLVEAVLPYVEGAAYTKVKEQLELFRADQPTLHAKASRIADRWLAFEVELSDSLHYGYATEEIEDFIRGLAFEWNDEMAETILDHTDGFGRIRMTRELAAMLEVSRRNTLWVSAAVITQNKRVISQLSAEAAQQIYENEMFIQTMMINGFSSAEIKEVETQNNKVVAEENVTAGGGCPGSASGLFSGSKPKGDDGGAGEKKCPEVKNGQSVKCPGCKEMVKAIVPNKESIFCSNPSCKLALPGLKHQEKHQEAPKPAQPTGRRVAEVALAAA